MLLVFGCWILGTGCWILGIRVITPADRRFKGYCKVFLFRSAFGYIPTAKTCQGSENLAESEFLLVPQGCLPREIKAKPLLRRSISRGLWHNPTWSLSTSIR